MGYIILSFVIVLLIVCFAAILNVQNQKYKELQQQKNTELYKQKQELITIQQQKDAAIRQQKQELASIQSQIENCRAGLDREKQAYENAKLVSDTQQNELRELNQKRQDLTESIENQKKQLIEIQSAAKDAQDRNIVLQNNIAALQQDLESLKSQHKAATKLIDTSNLGLILKSDDRMIRMYNTLEKLKDEYVELADCFSAAQWNKIWQPQFKIMTVEIQDKCGIYRIFTVDQQSGIQKSYVGQAKDIRERWSDHIKKMCGVKNLTKQDDAKFYSNVKPYEAHFEIIEECREAELNEKEHYWIDYYNCISDGYNTKK